jgi:RNA polymerase sigma-B factor
MTTGLHRGDHLVEEFRAYRTTRSCTLRNSLVDQHRPLAIWLARKFANRGEPFDDLVQVAQVALIHAVERFDPDRNVRFGTFAAATISGELKRHFRDRTWSLRVPRRSKELHLRLGPAIAELSQRLGRTPSVGDLAVELDVDEDAVLSAMDVGQAYRSDSLDLTGSEFDASIQDQVGDADPGYDAVEGRAVLDHLLRTLSERERRILALRFYDEMTQAEIGREIGVTQMHVSRVITRSLVSLRRIALADHAADSAAQGSIAAAS